MTRIACGWCGASTEVKPCSSCGRDPELAHAQRGRPAPALDDQASIARRLADARHRLSAGGRAITVERLAEELDVSPRTVRRWQQMAAR